MPAEESTGLPFRKINNTDLDTVAVVAQCLDNQWVPRSVLTTMIDRGWSLNHRKVIRRRLQESRHEYLRSLLNSQQVIINRAFFINNRNVYRDFLNHGDERNAFMDLLSSSAIVPYLVTEASPNQPQAFTVQSEGWQAWQRVISECSSSCLRLSWDNDENAEYTRNNLVRPFRRFLLSMADFEKEGLKRDFGVSDEDAVRLNSRLHEVARWAIDNERIDREDFYRNFVVIDGTDPADGFYDQGKPFAGELKQLADLRYNTVLADAIDRYSLTPTDSLHRAALQEERQLGRASGPDLEALLRMLLRRRAFDLVQNALDIGFTGVDLKHVWYARGTDEWVRYITSLKSLIAVPEDFESRAQDVYSRYVDLARRLGSIVGDRHRRNADRWEPIIQITVEALGSVITVIFGTEPRVEVIGKVASGIAARASVAVVRFAIVGRDQRRASNELGTSVDIMRVRFHRTSDDWEYLITELRRAGFPVRSMIRQPEADANLDVPEKEDA